MVCIFCRHLGAILKKEWLYMKRNPIRSIAELLIPFILMILLLLTRWAVPINKRNGGPDYEAESLAIDSSDEVTIMNGLINFGRYYRWYFNKTDLSNKYALGIAPKSNELAKKLNEYFEEKNVNTKFFDSEQDLVKYAANPTYENDKVVNLTTGIVFTGKSSDDYSYKIMVDKMVVMDVSNNFIDPLQK